MMMLIFRPFVKRAFAPVRSGQARMSLVLKALPVPRPPAVVVSFIGGRTKEETMLCVGFLPFIANNYCKCEDFQTGRERMFVIDYDNLHGITLLKCFSVSFWCSVNVVEQFMQILVAYPTVS
jgi:hypothetical protein